MSLESYNGINITTFIQNVEWVTFQFTAPVDSNGEFIVPNTPQTFYLESVVIQPGTSAVPSVSIKRVPHFNFFHFLDISLLYCLLGVLSHCRRPFVVELECLSLFVALLWLLLLR